MASTIRQRLLQVDPSSTARPIAGLQRTTPTSATPTAQPVAIMRNRKIFPRRVWFVQLLIGPARGDPASAAIWRTQAGRSARPLDGQVT